MQQEQWNRAYENGRDYLGLTTVQIDRLCSYVNIVDGKIRPRLLDIGCGTGQLAREMFHRGYDTVGIDPSSSAIEIATKSSTFVGDGIEFRVGDSATMLDGTFDIISCKYVVAFLPDRKKLYSRLMQHMSNSSVFVVMTPQLDMLPGKKKAIAVEDSALLAELTSYFGEVTQLKEQGDWWYICKK